jgi:poly(beta-D-mannuronate) lyase
MKRIAFAASLFLLGANLAHGRDCPPVPPAARDIIVHGYYGDARKSVIDRQKQQQNRLDRKEVTTFINGYLRLVDRYAETGDRNALKCANDRLARWAADGAMLGSLTFFGEAIRNWAVISISLAYLRSGPSADAAQDRLIKSWIREMTSRAIAFFGNRKSKNNLFYWSGFAAISASVLLKDQQFRDYGIAAYSRAMNDIRPDGTLAAEMKRGQRAAHYHAFAAEALT